jgi:DHA2 family multidrug resistance protein
MNPNDPALVAIRPFIVVCVMMATIMQALDTTIANVALPYMQGSLSTTQDQINWVLTSYIVAAAIMTPPVGWLTARFGRRTVLLVSVAGFTTASVLCGIATSIEEMVLFRLLQGVFGAALVPMSQAVMVDLYPIEQRGSAMAMWGVGVMVGPILGPTLGGWLTETWNWRWVFFVNVPFGILTFMGLVAFLPNSQKNTGMKMDWLGFGLLSLAIGAFQMMLDRGEQLDWFASTEVTIEAVLAGLALYLFIVHTATAEKPFINPRIFADRNLSAGLVFMFVIGIVLLATIALITPYLQNLMGYPVMTAGMVLGPRGIGTMIAMALVGRLMSRLDPRLLIGFGLSLTTIALWEMSGFTPDVSVSTIVWTGAVQGLGLGFVFVPLSTISFATLAPQFRTDGAAFLSLVRNLGSAIGISVVIFLLSHNTVVMHADLVAHLTPFNTTLFLPNVQQVFPTDTTAGLALLDATVTRQAQIIAYANDFYLMAFITLAAFPLLLIMRPPRRAPAGPKKSEEMHVAMD